MATREIRTGVTSIGLFGIALLVRSIPAARVFEGERVHLFGSDAHYHLRRALYSLENFPASLGFDPYINFPHGGEPIWTPVFDWLLALVALPFFHGADPAAATSIEVVLAWVPPLLGAATVVLLYRLARFVEDETTAVVSALILAVLSGHYWYSQVGFVDHHAAVALLSVVLLACTCRFLVALELGGARIWPVATGLALALAAIVLLWPGALLHVAIVEGFLLLAWPTRTSRRDARRWALTAALVNAIAAAGVAPLGLASSWSAWSDFSPAVLSRFQPWLFAALALHAALCAAVWRGGWGRSVRARLLEAAGIGAAIALLSISLFPGLLQGGLDSLRWLLKEEIFQALVAESKPLFFGPGGFDVAAAEARLSRFVYLAPLAGVAMAWLGRAGAKRRATRLIVLQLLVLGGMTLLQRRFFNSFSVVLALTMGWSLVTVYRRTTRDASSPRRVALLGVVTIATGWLLLPVLQSYRLPLRNVVETMRGEPLTLPAGLVRRRSLARAALWLRQNTPPVSGFLDASVTPEYGVLALWTDGHVIEYLGRRPTVTNNFGDDLGEENFLLSYRFFQAPEDEAVALARRLGVRYALVQTTLGEQPQALPPDALLRRFSAPAAELPAAGPFRLVYDEPAGAHEKRQRLRIFELLEGRSP